MFTTIDENNGIVRTTWRELRHKFRKVDPYLSQLIDEVSPNQKMPIYLIYLPYGMIKGDTKGSYLPLHNGEQIKLSDSSVGKEILNDLGYGMNSSPLGIILDKYIEYFIEFDEQVFPYLIHGPGTIFNKGILLKNKNARNYSPTEFLRQLLAQKRHLCFPV